MAKVKRLKLIVLFFFATAALLIGLSQLSEAAVSRNMPVTVVCNYSSGNISPEFNITDYRELASALKGQMTGCGFQVTVSALDASKAMIGEHYVNDT